MKVYRTRGDDASSKQHGAIEGAACHQIVDRVRARNENISPRTFPNSPILAKAHHQRGCRTDHLESFPKIAETELAGEQGPPGNLQQIAGAGGNERILHVVRGGCDRNTGIEEPLDPGQSTRRQTIRRSAGQVGNRSPSGCSFCVAPSRVSSTFCLR